MTRSGWYAAPILGAAWLLTPATADAAVVDLEFGFSAPNVTPSRAVSVAYDAVDPLTADTASVQGNGVLTFDFAINGVTHHFANTFFSLAATVDLTPVEFNGNLLSHIGLAQGGFSLVNAAEEVLLQVTFTEGFYSNGGSTASLSFSGEADDAPNGVFAVLGEPLMSLVAAANGDEDYAFDGLRSFSFALANPLVVPGAVVDGEGTLVLMNVSMSGAATLIPEPASLALLGVGALLCTSRLRRAE